MSDCSGGVGRPRSQEGPDGKRQGRVGAENKRAV